MLAGHYPARRVRRAAAARRSGTASAGTVESRRDARTVAVISGGTIPDRGLFGVYPRRRWRSDGARAGHEGTRPARSGGRRVGELDEEMVYEAREGEVILLGASAWRIEQITHDRVLVTPAPGEPGKVPFWKGDGPGRPIELGRALGEFTRDDGRRRWRVARAAGRAPRSGSASATTWTSWPPRTCSPTWPRSWRHRRPADRPDDRPAALPRRAGRLADLPADAVRGAGPRARGRWRSRRGCARRSGLEVQPIWSDDGIVVRLPTTDERLGVAWHGMRDGTARRAARPGSTVDRAGRGWREEAVADRPSEDVEELVIGAARRLGAVLEPLPRERGAGAAAAAPPCRTAHAAVADAPARGAAAGVASRYGSFPIILETYRECLQDVFDLPALRGLLAAIEQREIRLVSVETPRASPFAASLLFDYIASYMYEGDAPLVDRRAQALALDRDLLRELLGAEELRELLDARRAGRAGAGAAGPDCGAGRGLGGPGARPAAPARRPDARRRSRRGFAARTTAARARAAGEWLEALAADRRAVEVRIAGERRWIAAEDVGALPRRARGGAAGGRAQALSWRRRTTRSAACSARWARHHGPFLAAGPASRWGMPVGDRRDGAGADARRRHAAARRVPARRRRARVVRPRGAASAAPALTGPAAARGRAGRAGGARRGSCRAGRASASARPRLERLAEVDRPARGHCRCPRACWSATSCRRGCAATARGCWTSSVPRARWSGSGSDRSARTTAASRCTDPTGWRCCCAVSDRATPRPRAAAQEAADAPRRGWLSRRDPRRSCATRGASFYRDLLAAAVAAAAERGDAAVANASCSMRCGTWSGRREVTNDTFAPLRALRWPRTKRRSRSAAALRRAHARMGPPEAPAAGRSCRRRLDRGRAVRRPAPTETERRHALAHAAARALRRGDARRGRGRRRSPAASRPCTRCCARWRSAAASGAATSSRASAAPSSRCRGAVDRLRAERATRPATAAPQRTMLLAAADPANPYGAALTWPRWATTTGARWPAPPAPTWCSSTASRCSTWSEAARRSRRCRRSRRRPPPQRRCATRGSWWPTAVPPLADRARRRRPGRRVALSRRARRRRLPAAYRGWLLRA